MVLEPVLEPDLFIHSLIQQILISAYYMPDIVLKH